jgi:voltage-gated potassium channel
MCGTSLLLDDPRIMARPGDLFNATAAEASYRLGGAGAKVCAMPRAQDQPHSSPWRRRLYVIIFRHDTPAGKAFDVLLLWAIAASILAVMLESVPSIHERYGAILLIIEWAFTILFTVEYALRLISVRSARHYALSFFGVIDLLAIAPTYLSLLLPGTQELIVIRALRLLRVFRVLKLSEYLGEASLLMEALRASRRKITVFLLTVLTLALIVGALMHLIEGPEHGFTSIPMSVYWAIVTVTTVGYGDVAPQTAVGRLIASVLMIAGYGIIAVPTGIVTAELVGVGRRRAAAGRACPECRVAGHEEEARFCNMCGGRLGRVDDAGSDGVKPPSRS